MLTFIYLPKHNLFNIEVNKNCLSLRLINGVNIRQKLSKWNYPSSKLNMCEVSQKSGTNVIISRPVIIGCAERIISLATKTNQNWKLLVLPRYKDLTSKSTLNFKITCLFVSVGRKLSSIRNQNHPSKTNLLKRWTSIWIVIAGSYSIAENYSLTNKWFEGANWITSRISHRITTLFFRRYFFYLEPR